MLKRHARYSRLHVSWKLRRGHPLSMARGPESVMRTFWSSLASLRNWSHAFVEAFGITPSAFYTDFSTWWATSPSG